MSGAPVVAGQREKAMCDIPRPYRAPAERVPDLAAKRLVFFAALQQPVGDEQKGDRRGRPSSAFSLVRAVVITPTPIA